MSKITQKLEAKIAMTKPAHLSYITFLIGAALLASFILTATVSHWFVIPTLFLLGITALDMFLSRNIRSN